MDSTHTLRDINPGSSLERGELRAFLTANGLDYEADTEGAVGVFDADERLVACGCYAGAVLKQFAVDDAERGNNLLGAVLSRLVQAQVERGVTRLFVFTKPDNAPLFLSSGFCSVASTEAVALLENRRNGPEEYARQWALPGAPGGDVAAIVMHANPFTLGHRHLVEQAAAACARVYVFVVEENRAAFPFSMRLALAEEGLADLDNVRVCPSGPYMIAASTFPSYFLKDKSTVPGVYARLDATVFATRLAPLFGITCRYVGTEPNCAVTRAYNGELAGVLPARGIAVREVPRLAHGGVAVSASKVREILCDKGADAAELAALLPQSTLRWLTSAAARPVLERLRGAPPKV